MEINVVGVIMPAQSATQLVDTSCNNQPMIMSEYGMQTPDAHVISNSIGLQTPEPRVITVGEQVGSGGLTDNNTGLTDNNAVNTAGESTVKRKRGRPRKTDMVVGSGSTTFSALPVSQEPKRGRGRPKGSGKRQLLATACTAGTLFETIGENFNIQVVTVHIGEDIVSKIASYARTSESVCVVSATGCVSSAVIRHPGSLGGVLRYEGVYEILSLKGLLSLGGRRPNMFSIVMAKPDGSVFGGGVAGALIAAGPVQLVVGTFTEIIKKEQKKARPRQSPAPSPSVPANPNQTTMNPSTNFNGTAVHGDGCYSSMPASSGLDPILNVAADIN